jgi:hypothetical protein
VVGPPLRIVRQHDEVIWLRFQIPIFSFFEYTSFERPAGNACGRSSNLAPVERFLAIETASGIVLMVAAVAALIWANSPWRAAYADLWHISLGFRFGSFR